MKRCPMRSHDTCAAKQEMGVIPEADNQMLQWTKDVLGEAIASLNPPAKEQQGRGVGIYLLEVAAEPREHVAPRPRLQLGLKYLVTSWADSANDPHRILTQLFKSAIHHPAFDIPANPPTTPF